LEESNFGEVMSFNEGFEDLSFRMKSTEILKLGISLSLLTGG